MTQPTWCPKCLKTEFETVKVRYDPATGAIISKPGLFDSAEKKQSYSNAPEGTGYHCSDSACEYTWTPADIVGNTPEASFQPLPTLSWGQPLKRKPKPDAATQNLSPNLQQLVEWLATGTQSQLAIAIGQLEDIRPREAIPALLQIASGKTTKLEERQLLATILLGNIGDPTAIKGLTDKSPTFRGSVPVICLTLGQIGHPSALPYLRKISQTDAMLEEMKDEIFQWRAYALIAQAMIGHADAFQGLVEDSEKEFHCSLYKQPSNLNALMFDKSLAWKMVGLAAAAMDHRAANKWKTQNAALMTRPDITLDVVSLAHPEVRRMWLFHLRLAVLDALVEVCGTEALLACRPKAKNSIKKLMIALPLIKTGLADRQWQDCLVDSMDASDLSERLLAYEACVQFAIKTSEPQYTQWAQSGLKDRDKQVQAAVGAAILYYQLQPLVPQALDLAQSKSSDIRISMIGPVAEFAKSGDPRGTAALTSLKNDRDKKVKEIAQEWEN